MCFEAVLPQGLFCSPKMTPRKNKLAFFRALIDFVNFYHFFIKKRGSEASTFLKALCFEAVLPQGLFCSPKWHLEKITMYFSDVVMILYFFVEFHWFSSPEAPAWDLELGILFLGSWAWNLGLGLGELGSWGGGNRLAGTGETCLGTDVCRFIRTLCKNPSR